MKKTNQNNKKEKILIGTAVRDSKNNCVPILIERDVIHPVYRKAFRISKKYLCLTNEEVKKGQKVGISESRPQSKKISWKVIKIVEGKE